MRRPLILALGIALPLLLLLALFPPMVGENVVHYFHEHRFVFGPRVADSGIREWQIAPDYLSGYASLHKQSLSDAERSLRAQSQFVSYSVDWSEFWLEASVIGALVILVLAVWWLHRIEKTRRAVIVFCTLALMATVLPVVKVEHRNGYNRPTRIRHERSFLLSLSDTSRDYEFRSIAWDFLLAQYCGAALLAALAWLAPTKKKRPTQKEFWDEQRAKAGTESVRTAAMISTRYTDLAESPATQPQPPASGK